MATEKRYYWLKLQDGFFGSKRIKKLRTIAGGDTYTIIYLKMQLLAMKTGGYLEYTGLEDTFAKELALDLDEKDDNVEITVNYLLSCGLLEPTDGGGVYVPYAVENTGSEGASTKRVREHRGRKSLQCNAEVTQVKQIGNGEKEIEKELEIEKEIETEVTADEPPTTSARVDYEAIKLMYNKICVSFPRCTSLSDARKKAIKARFASGHNMEDFESLFIKAEASSFLKGANNRNWHASFDWLLKDANMAKVLDGNYDDRKHNGSQGYDDNDLDFIPN